ncbi:MAG: sensor histidine kinase [Spirosomataceae bacterium]
MKNLLIGFLLITIHFGVYAQNEVFRIDNIPSTGILLNKGWKFHAGDNPAWAKPDFDDSQWESIDPTKDFHEMPNFKTGEVGWLRVKLAFDTSSINKNIELVINQYIASEVYYNGILKFKFGKIGTTAENSIAFRTYYKPNTYLITHPYLVICVRYRIQKALPYINLPPLNETFRLFISKVNQGTYYGNYVARSLRFSYFSAGVLFLLSIIHFIYFFSYKQLFSNLFFALAMLAESIAILILNNYYYYQDILVEKLTNVNIVFIFLFFSAQYSLIYAAIFNLLGRKPNSIFYTKILILLAGVPIMIKFYGGIGNLILTSTFLLGMIESLLLVLRKVRQEKSLGILLIGITFYLFIFFATLLIIFNVIPNYTIDGYYNLYDVLFSLSTLCLPITFSIFLARNYGFISINFENQLAENQRLAQEKQEALEKQNAELQAALLQGQTLERKRVAADLHDNLGATMSSLLWTLDAIDTPKLQPNERQIYQSFKQMVANAYNEVRLLSHNLLPEEFEKQGLVPTLQGFVRKISKNSTIRFDLAIAEDFGRVDNKIEFELYSICLELVNNIIKHSKATEATIELSRTKKQISLIVSDNGIGTFSNESDGKGMKNVRARVESLGGEWKVIAEEGRGVKNQIAVPV